MRVAVVALIAAAVCAGTACGRANPRLHELVRTQGSTQQTTEIAYDGDGHPATVNIAAGIVTQTLKLRFQGARLVRVETDTREGDVDRGIDRTDFTYEGDRIRQAITTLANSGGTRTTDISYDDQGHVDAVDERDQDAAAADPVVTVSRGDDGISKLVLGAGTAQQSFRFTYESGRVQSSDVDRGGGSGGTSTFRYRDGRIDRVDFDGVGVTGQPQHGAITYDYDDQGRMSEVIASEDGAPDSDTVLRYDDGDAADIDVTPASVSLFLLWDLKGEPFNDFDARTQPARFIGASW